VSRLLLTTLHGPVLALRYTSCCCLAVVGRGQIGVHSLQFRSTNQFRNQPANADTSTSLADAPAQSGLGYPSCRRDMVHCCFSDPPTQNSSAATHTSSVSLGLLLNVCVLSLPLHPDHPR
jgi:hypothetical protein